MFIPVRNIFLYMDLHCLCWQVELNLCFFWTYMAYLGFSLSWLLLKIQQLSLLCRYLQSWISKEVLEEGNLNEVKLLLKSLKILLANRVMSLSVAFSYLVLCFILILSSSLTALLCPLLPSGRFFPFSGYFPSGFFFFFFWQGNLKIDLFFI